MDTQTILATLARTGLKALAGFLIGHGYLQSSGTEAFVGAGMALAAAAWSFWNDYGAAILKADLDMLKARTQAAAQKAQTSNPGPKAAVALLAVCLAGAFLSHGTAHAQTKRLSLPLPIPLPSSQPAQSTSIDPLAAALLKPFQAIADFIAGDNQGAIALSTAVPELQDGHGQQCWMAAKTFSDVIKAHPIPLTLKLQTDIEAFRLLGMATNQLCANVHCTQVFADLESTAQAAGPINIGVPLPTLHDLCSKVPQIAVVAPIATPVPTTTSAPAAQ